MIGETVENIKFKIDVLDKRANYRFNVEEFSDNGNFIKASLDSFFIINNNLSFRFLI
jgi:hypothetical protein